jgi:hypothetical protein
LRRGTKINFVWMGSEVGWCGRSKSGLVHTANVLWGMTVDADRHRRSGKLVYRLVRQFTTSVGRSGRDVSKICGDFPIIKPHAFFRGSVEWQPNLRAFRFISSIHQRLFLFILHQSLPMSFSILLFSKLRLRTSLSLFNIYSGTDNT